MFKFQHNGINGIGNAFWYLKHNPPTQKDIMDLIEEIRDKYYPGHGICIINLIPLSEDEEYTKRIDKLL